MNDLIPIAANAAIALTLLTTAYALRGQSGRHTAGMTRPHAPYANPYDGRIRAAFRHYAGHTREAGLTTGALR